MGMMLFAHGVGSRANIALSGWQLAWVCAAVLVAAFLLTDGRAIKVAPNRVRPIPASSGALKVLEPSGRIAAALAVAAVVVAGLIGDNDSANNLAPVALLSIGWLLLPPLATLVGDAWSVVSPYRMLAGQSAMDGAVTIDGSMTEWFPPVAAIGILLLELLHPGGPTPFAVGIAALAYSVAVAVGARRWGRAWVSRAELFAVYLSTMGTLAPLTRTNDGALGWRRPIASLAQHRLRAPAVATLLVVVGGVLFDGFTTTDVWHDIAGTSQRLGRGAGPAPRSGRGGSRCWSPIPGWHPRVGRCQGRPH